MRLRYPGDKNQFLPMEQVVDTMLHELCHNVIGPHNEEFHALWDQLRKEYEGLLSKGYTGEGFLSDGHKLGGRQVPRDEARRIARKAAEKRRTLEAGSGQKLGGRAIPVGTDIRSVIVDAIERRSTVTKGCGGGGNKNDKEIEILADEATQNGFRTKAEMDEANDRAIAQALWELVQEDEKKEYGDSYIPPTPANPTGSGGSGGSEAGSSGSIKREASSSPTQVKSKPPPIRQIPGRPVSRLVTENAAKKPKTQPSKTSTAPPIPVDSKPVPPSSSSSKSSPPVPKASKPSPTLAQLTGWTCPACTLHNPINFLACDACTSERPSEVTLKLAEAEKRAIAASRPASTKTWICSRCTTETEDSFWSCRSCGKIKDSS